MFMAASRTLAQVTNTHIPRNKAIVGTNAFAHEAGIHQHGVLANPETYEIMKPEDVGQPSSQLVMGKHSGKHALQARAKGLGFDLEGDALNEAFVAFKDVADELGLVDDARLCAILGGLKDGSAPNLWALSRLEIRAPISRTAQPSARIELEHTLRGRVTDIALAPGALDAAFQAVSEIMDVPARVTALDLQYIADDADANAPNQQGADVLVEIEIFAEDDVYHGRHRGRDVIPVCVSAYIDALNNVCAHRTQMLQQANQEPEEGQPALASTAA
jgi:2-isopropylmalate synthase